MSPGGMERVQECKEYVMGRAWLSLMPVLDVTNVV